MTTVAVPIPMSSGNFKGDLETEAGLCCELTDILCGLAGATVTVFCSELMGGEVGVPDGGVGKRAVASSGGMYDLVRSAVVAA